MYSLGTSFITTESILSSLPTHGEMFPTSTTVFAAPLTIELNFICAICEYSFGMPNGKTGEMKQLEDIALEYFKRRVLKTEEESFGGNACAVFPEDSDGTRYRKLLSSITLCDRCINHCAKMEEGILRDQLNYLEKMTGCKRLEEVFADPWLDLKRFAYHKLRCEEPIIREKLELIEKLFGSAGAGTSSQIVLQNRPCASSSATSGVTASTSTSSKETPKTTSQQIVVTTVNFTGTSPTESNTTNMDISKQLTICQSTRAGQEVSSKASSRVGSPKQDKDNEVSIESTFKDINDENDTTGPEPASSHQNPNLDKVNDEKHITEPEPASSHQPQNLDKVNDENDTTEPEPTSSNQLQNLVKVNEENDTSEPEPVSSHQNQNLDNENAAKKPLDTSVNERKVTKQDNPDESEEIFEDSNSSREEDSDSDESFVVESAKKKGKRKRPSKDGKGNKRKKIAIKFGKSVEQVALANAKELALSSQRAGPSSTQKKTPSSSLKKTPVSTTKSGKKSTTPADSFVTPPVPKKQKQTKKSLGDNKTASGSSGGKGSNSFSVVELAKKRLGEDVVKNINTNSSLRTSPRKEFRTPEKSKKTFKIGNRYMTDPSSSEDSSDNDATFVPNQANGNSD